MADSRAIGVFDSGLGGLTVVRELIRRNPCEDIVYFGDTGRVPYGTRSHETIKKYAAEDERFLLKHNVKLIIAACGTVSSVAADTAVSLPVPFFEMVTHAARAAVNATRNRKIGVIGTAATVLSGSHKKEILKLLPDAKVTAESCPLFVPLVENGHFDTPVAKLVIEEYLEESKIIYHRIQVATPRHNGKVERQHRLDEQRFYSKMRMYNLADGRKQLAKYNKISNNIPKSCLKYRSPSEVLEDYLCVM